MVRPILYSQEKSPNSNNSLKSPKATKPPKIQRKPLRKVQSLIKHSRIHQEEQKNNKVQD